MLRASTYSPDYGQVSVGVISRKSSGGYKEDHHLLGPMLTESERESEKYIPSGRVL